MQLYMPTRIVPTMVSLQMLGMLGWKDRPGMGSRTSLPLTSPHLPHLIALCTEDIGLSHQRQHAQTHDQSRDRPCYVAISVTPPICHADTKCADTAVDETI